MQNAYSFVVGLRNSLLGMVAFGAGLLLAAHPEVSNQSVVDFLAQHLQSVLGTVTVGGLVNLGLDFLHQKWNIASAQRASQTVG